MESGQFERLIAKLEEIRCGIIDVEGEVQISHIGVKKEEGHEEIQRRLERIERWIEKVYLYFRWGKRG